MACQRAYIGHYTKDVWGAVPHYMARWATGVVLLKEEVDAGEHTA